ncbi:MAG: two-component system, chemotaxis family, CheB/CheR fusion protein, partial [Verrucomicrobiota bacterium]
MGFVLVQHLDPIHESALPQLMTRVTSLPVSEVVHNVRVEPDQVYVIPPNANLSIKHGVLKLEPRPVGRAPHLSIDYFFESLAQDQRECAIGVILSGSATDGTQGLEAIKAEGGITFAQDDSAAYDSMPRNAVAAGCVDFEMPPADIARELSRIAKHPYLAREGGKFGAPETRIREGGPQGQPKENEFKKIVQLLRTRFGVDFSLYKPNTMERRIARRMLLNKMERAEEYAAFLRARPRELEALYSDMLINVTSFFRNPAAFDLLEHKVFPALVKQPRDKPIRV